MASLRDAGRVSFDDPVVSLRSTTGYRLGSRWDHPDRPMSDHFPDVRKMVLAGRQGMNAEARELEAKIAENVVDLLEA